MSYQKWREFRAGGADADEILAYMQISTAPVPVAALVTALGIQIIQSPTTQQAPDTVGFYIATPGSGHGTALYLPMGSLEIRFVRFQMAHLIGRLLSSNSLYENQFHWFSNVQIDDNLDGWSANLFAMDFLMPLWLVPSNMIPTVPLLAAFFQVPAFLAERRLESL